MDILYIVIPAYNEEANIRQVIREWYPVIEAHPGGGASRMVVIDDGSRDGTFEILKEEAEEHPMLTPVTRTNSGHGATVLYGYRYALEHHADYVFQTDSDGQTRPEEFEPFWKERENCQMVIGWRNARQDGFGRIVTTRVLRLVVTLCFHVRIRDANTPYRLMQAGAPDPGGLFSLQCPAARDLCQKETEGEGNPHHVPAKTGRKELHQHEKDLWHRR